MDWYADNICNIHNPLNPLCRDAQFLFCGFDAKHLNEVNTCICSLSLFMYNCAQVMAFSPNCDVGSELDIVEEFS